MSWTLRNSGSGSSGSSSTTITASVTGVVAGDSVIVFAGNDSSASISSISDGTTTFTLAGLNSSATVRMNGGYLLSSVASGTVTYTVTFSATCSVRCVHVWVFTPSAAASIDTERHDGVGVGTTSADSGNITTTGSDDAVVACCYHETAGTSSLTNINGSAATGVIDTGSEMSSWYKFFSGTFTSNATATVPNSRFLINIIALKITASGTQFTARGGIAMSSVTEINGVAKASLTAVDGLNL